MLNSGVKFPKISLRRVCPLLTPLLRSLRDDACKFKKHTKKGTTRGRGGGGTYFVGRGGGGQGNDFKTKYTLLGKNDKKGTFFI